MRGALDENVAEIHRPITFRVNTAAGLLILENRSPMKVVSRPRRLRHQHLER